MVRETTKGVIERLVLYCDAMQVPLPPLHFDNHDVVLTDLLLEWIAREGISIDWLLSGTVKTEDEIKFREMVKCMPLSEQKRLLAALKDYDDNGGVFEEVMSRHGVF